MLSEMSAGGVVYSWHGSTPMILMIRDRFGRWTFPKGLIEKGESPEEAAVREICEETGVCGTVERYLGDVTYVYTSDNGLVRKTVRYFLVRSSHQEPSALLSEIAEARWVAPDDARCLNGYDDNREMLEMALSAILDRD